jgi:hypothetical protein
MQNDALLLPFFVAVIVIIVWTVKKQFPMTLRYCHLDWSVKAVVLFWCSDCFYCVICEMADSDGHCNIVTLIEASQRWILVAWTVKRQFPMDTAILSPWLKCRSSGFYSCVNFSFFLKISFFVMYDAVLMRCCTTCDRWGGVIILAIFHTWIF